MNIQSWSHVWKSKQRIECFFDQAVKYLEITDVPRKIAPKFSFFFLLYLQVDTGRAGGERILPERQKRGGCTASFSGGGGGGGELYEIMDGGLETLAWF